MATLKKFFFKNAGGEIVIIVPTEKYSYKNKLAIINIQQREAWCLAPVSPVSDTNRNLSQNCTIQKVIIIVLTEVFLNKYTADNFQNVENKNK